MSTAGVAKRVLIADDEPAVLDMLKEFFRQFRHGHEYELATVLNGADACREVGRARPDLVLLDMHMPEMDGLEVLKHIRDVDRTIPVIMVTGNRDIQAAADAHTAGIFAYIPKPFDVRHLDMLVGLATGAAASPTQGSGRAEGPPPASPFGGSPSSR